MQYETECVKQFAMHYGSAAVGRFLGQADNINPVYLHNPPQIE